MTANTGSNNWNTNGAWVGGVQPGAGDDVTIPASAVVTIPTATTVLARSVTVAASATLAFASTTAVLTIGDGTAGAGNVALSISASATITLTGVGTINLVSTSATQQTITSGGKTLPSMTFSGVGSSYLLADSLTLAPASGVLTVSNGIFDSGNQAISVLNFVSTSGLTRTLTLGSSAITTAGSSAWNTNNITGLTVTTNTAVVTLTTTTTMTLCNNTFNFNGLSIVCTGNGTYTIALGGSPTIKNLTYNGSSVKTNQLRFSGATTLNISGTLTVTGQSATNRVLVGSTTTGSVATLNVTTGKSFSNVDWMDITAAGTQAPFTGSSMGDCLGNTSITFDAPATQTHTAAAGGNWSDVSVWTSRVPLPQDNVVINGSTTGTITADMPRLGANIDFTGFAGTASFSISTNIFGSITLATGMTLSGSFTITLAGRSSLTVTSATKSFTQPIAVTAPGGTYTLADAFSTSGTFTTGAGTFTTAGFNMTALSWGMTTGVNTVNLGASIVTLTGTAGTLWNTNTSAGFPTLNAGTSEIVYSSASASSRTFAGGNRTYNKLTYTVAGSTGTLVITGSNTIGTLNFSDATNARTLQFTAGTTTTILAAFNVNGTPGKLMSVQSATAATHTLSKSSGVVACDYLSLTNSIAQGGANWYAGANSTDGGGNTGWIFTAAVLGNFFRMF